MNDRTQPSGDRAGAARAGRRQTGAVLWGELRESFSMAMAALAAHKLRSALTLLGVLIGVFSIIVVMTAMRVLQKTVETEIRSIGSHTFVIQKWPATIFVPPKEREKYARRQNITVEQGRRVMERVSLPLSVGLEEGVWSGEVETRYAKSSPNVQLLGGTPGLFPARNWTVREGRALVDSDVDGAREVCVLGDAVARTVFPHGSPVGERLKVDGINYTVVGVLEARGQLAGGNQDNFVVIPITTGMNRYGGRWRSVSIFVQAPSQELYEATVDQVRGALRAIRKVPPGEEDDFEIFSSDSVMRQFNSFTLVLRIGVAVVSSISLLAAGIGIMNIMLVSVTERTREIGIRRAVGARKRNIMTQFIMEAVVLCEVGGVIGVVLGVLGGNATAVVLKLTPAIPVDWIVVGLVICSIVGVAFGTYPAYKAANLDPIESLRYE
ncbi:MAG TPA: FtsX-like permease family protein [Verrucomicrobia bacterium]|nr:FtsX-like permease family protein [Verrucomicrobiota bacterium]HOP99121.1 ABC transporter permease [Verrucomicrobiota bacterium]